MRIFKKDIHPGFPIRYWFVCIFYFILSVIGILHHEIWLDEMHHFLLARDSSNLQELAFNGRYDGHPLLWDGLLFFLTRFTHNPFYMQLLHIAIALTAVIIFLRNSPFTDFFKIIFVFGYFMLYEYNIISRNYALGILFLFISCSLICTKKRNYTAIMIALLILSYTHLFSLLCSVSLFIVTISLYSNDIENKIPRTRFQFICFVYVLATGFILWCIIPPTDHVLIQHDTTPYLSFKRIGKGFSIFFKGLYHLPNFTKYNFWNTNWIVDVSKNTGMVLSVICFLFPLLIFFNKPISLVVFYLSAIGIAAFIFLSPIIPGVRYFGFVSLLLVISLWVSEFTKDYLHQKIPLNLILRIRKFNQYFKVPFVYSFLLLQLLSSAVVYSLDIIRPFSEGKAVAEYLIKNKLTQKPIVVPLQYSGPPISGYLDQKVFYPETNDFGSFCNWNNQPSMFDKKDLISWIKKNNSDDLILVLNDSLFNSIDTLSTPVYRDNQLTIYFLASFHQGIMSGENYWLYEAKKTNTK